MKSNEIIKTTTSVMLIAILVVLSALIMGTILDNSAFDDNPVTGTNTNETLSGVTNVTASSFSILSSYPTATCSLTSVVNATGGETIPASNYTYSLCTIIASDDSAYIGEDWNVTYTFSRPSGTNTAGVNVTLVSTAFGSFLTAIFGFFALLGTIIAIVWVVRYIKVLFDKKEGINAITA